MENQHEEAQHQNQTLEETAEHLNTNSENVEVEAIAPKPLAEIKQSSRPASPEPTVVEKHQQQDESNLTESIVNIQSIDPDTYNYNQESNEAYEKQNSRPSSPPPPVDTSVDLNTSINTNETNENTNVNEDIITESIIEIQSIVDQILDQTNNENNDDKSLTKSTVVLTTSQIMTDEGSSDLDRCVELEAINHFASKQNEENNLNTESMIVTNLSSEASSFVSSPVQQNFTDNQESDSNNERKENETENVNETTNLTAEEKQTIKENEDYEKLEKEYEIPNFASAENSLRHQLESINLDTTSKIEELKTEIELEETQTPVAAHEPELEPVPTQAPVEEKPKRNIQNENYQKLLGNDSLMKKILEYGDESIGRPTKGQMVTISYEAKLKDDDQKLVDHNENLSFILGDGDVISGMDMIVSLMDKNEKCEMIAEARHAYGSLGKQPDIPANASLVYKIHLKDFNDITEFNLMSPVERLSLAEAKKIRGNFHYNRQDFPLAIGAYKKGLKYFDEENLKIDEDKTDLEKYLEITQALLMNTALSYFKMGDCRAALSSLDQVLGAQSKHIKALYIKGKVLLQLGETEDAVKCLTLALQLDPTNLDVKKELSKAQAKHKIQYDNEKKMYQKMISGVSKTETDEAKIKLSKISKSGKNKKDSSYVNYIAAGLVVAAASVGVALFARYKNAF